MESSALDLVQVELPEGHAAVIADSFRQNLPERTEPITVRSLERFGYSGARLYLCFRRSIPFVVKVDEASRIRSEYDATKSVSDNFGDIDAYAPAFRRPVGALLYKHKGGFTPNQIGKSTELRNLIFDQQSKRDGTSEFVVTDAYLRQVFQALYDRVLEAPRNAHERRPLDLSMEYARALRLERSHPVVECLLGQSRRKPRLNYLGTEILNPRLYIDKILRRKLSAAVGPVHGDLHASNVVVDSHRGVHLIDFAKARPEAHLLRDYVLMECSLRFMLFPHHANLEEQEDVDKHLLDEDGTDYLRTYDRGDMAGHYRRLGETVGIIRRFARKVLESQSFDEYLISLFLVLYGNLGYPSYNRHAAVRALGLIADGLERSGGR